MGNLLNAVTSWGAGNLGAAWPVVWNLATIVVVLVHDTHERTRTFTQRVRLRLRLRVRLQDQQRLGDDTVPFVRRAHIDPHEPGRDRRRNPAGRLRCLLQPSELGLEERHHHGLHIRERHNVSHGRHPAT